MSDLQPVHQAYVDDGLVVLSVLIRRKDGGRPTTEDAVAWRTTLGLTYDTLVDEVGTFTAEWNPDERVPMAYVLGRDGAVLLKHTGGGVDEVVDVALDELAR